MSFRTSKFTSLTLQNELRVGIIYLERKCSYSVYKLNYDGLFVTKIYRNTHFDEFIYSALGVYR